MKRRKGFELAGHFNVDAGQVLIADPCYIIRDVSDESVNAGICFPHGRRSLIVGLISSLIMLEVVKCH